MIGATTTSPLPPLNLTSNPARFVCANLGFRLRYRLGLRQLSSSGKMELFRSWGCYFAGNRPARKIEVDSVNGGGQDVFDTGSAAASVPPDHLVIMVNGIIGSAADWRYAAKQFVKQLPDKVIVHCSECNSSMLTFDGVDRMGERLAEEVLGVVRRWPGVTKISFVAHSLGGLVARYAIGKLYENIPVMESSSVVSSEDLNKSTQFVEQCYEARVAGLEPMNFITFATPHLGSRGHKQLPLLCGLPFLERTAPQTAHWIAGRSGKHLFLTDGDDGRPPLLLQMVNDSEDIRFMSALRSFKRRVAYANSNYDHVVGWRTSSIRRQHELPKTDLLLNDEKYPHIVYIEREMGEVIENGASTFVGANDLEEEMIKGLTQVPWERVDVSFQKSTQRYVAHSTIQIALRYGAKLSDLEIMCAHLQSHLSKKKTVFVSVVKSYWLNSDGADVVSHMIDNFLH